MINLVILKVKSHLLAAQPETVLSDVAIILHTTTATYGYLPEP